MIIKYIICRLNLMLKNNFEEDAFLEMIRTLKNDFGLEIMIADFLKNTSEQSQKIQEMKMACIDKGEYEMAARLRDEEREILRLIELKEMLSVKESVFIKRPEGVYYLHLGNMKNDEIILKLLKL